MKKFLYNVLSNLTSRVAPHEDKTQIIKSPMTKNRELAVKAINDILNKANRMDLEAVCITYMPKNILFNDVPKSFIRNNYNEDNDRVVKYDKNGNVID